MDLTLAKKEYFQLINFLNTGNTFTNKKTKMYFYIDSVNLTAKTANSSGFYSLEEYLVFFFKNLYTEKLDITEQIVSHLFQFPDECK